MYIPLFSLWSTPSLTLSPCVSGDLPRPLAPGAGTEMGLVQGWACDLSQTMRVHLLKPLERARAQRGFLSQWAKSFSSWWPPSLLPCAECQLEMKPAQKMEGPDS